jgi:hypothetical protein
MFGKNSTAPISEREIIAFLRQHKGTLFTKPEIAQGVAEERISRFTFNRQKRLAACAMAIESELLHMRLRDLPKVARSNLVRMNHKWKMAAR